MWSLDEILVNVLLFFYSFLVCLLFICCLHAYIFILLGCLLGSILAPGFTLENKSFFIHLISFFFIIVIFMISDLADMYIY